LDPIPSYPKKIGFTLLRQKNKLSPPKLVATIKQMHGQMGEKESQVLPILMVDFAKLEYFGTFILKNTYD
jgi:hypothetical protein